MTGSAASAYVPVTVAYGLRSAARRTPAKPALVNLTTGETRSCVQLARNLCRTRNALEAMALPRGARVAIVAANRLDYLETVAGIADAGLVAVTINPALHEREIAAILAHCGAQLVLADGPSRERLPAQRDVARVESLDSEWMQRTARASDTGHATAADERDVFAICYTSGTTGQPKGVMLSHRARVLMMLYGMAGGYGVHNPACRAFASSPFATGGGLAHLLAPVFFGGTTYFCEKFSATAFLDAVPAHHLNYASLVPTQIHAILEADGAGGGGCPLGSLRVLVSNAAPLPQATKYRLIERLPQARLFDSYGATELGMVAHLRPEEMLSREHCVGLAAPGVELRVVDEEGRDVPPGDVGQIAVRSPWLFTGYLDDPAATAQAWIGDWCSVGDLGRQDAEGYLYLVDRLHNVINSGGQNIYASEVEQVLYAHPAVAEAAVVGVPHPYWGEAVNAVVRLRGGASVSAAQLVEHCAAHLARFKLPKRVEFWDELPQSAAGKVLHREIRERLSREARAAPVAS